MKLVIVVRTDLNMSEGKMIAQAIHSIDAKQAAYECAAIVCCVNSRNELSALYDKAQRAGIMSNLVVDAGRTEVEPGTITVVSIGPDEDEEINKITGSLKLL